MAKNVKKKEEKSEYDVLQEERMKLKKGLVKAHEEGNLSKWIELKKELVEVQRKMKTANR